MALAIAAGPALAAAEPFLDLFTGTVDTGSADVRIKQPEAGSDFTIKGLSFSDRSFEEPPYVGARAGYFFEGLPWLGVGLEYFHFKMIGEVSASRQVTGTRRGAPIDATVPVNAFVQQFSVSNGVSYVSLDVLARYGFLADPEGHPRGRLQLYAGGGVGPVITYALTTIDGVASRSGYELGGVGVQGFAGLRFMLLRQVGVFVEGKVTRASLTVGVARGGEGRVDETSRHIVAGITLVLP
jgi:hypothetical protein